MIQFITKVPINSAKIIKGLRIVLPSFIIIFLSDRNP